MVFVIKMLEFIKTNLVTFQIFLVTELRLCSLTAMQKLNEHGL